MKYFIFILFNDHLNLNLKKMMRMKKSLKSQMMMNQTRMRMKNIILMKNFYFIILLIKYQSHHLNLFQLFILQITFFANFEFHMIILFYAEPHLIHLSCLETTIFHAYLNFLIHYLKSHHLEISISS